MANVITIEGVGEVMATKLKAVGISSTRQLLKACGDRSGREKVAESAGIDYPRLLRFVNHADLMRIRGIGGQFAEALEASGVDSVPELARRNPSNLAEAIRAVNTERRLIRRVPSSKEIERWVEQAKKLKRVVTH